MATIYRSRYEWGLRQGINRARWVEYSISASVMMVGIALLSGIFDLAALILIFALVAIMSLMGLAMERQRLQSKKTDWFNYWIGVLAGAVPWAVVAFALFSASVYGNSAVPGFVYWIYGSIFLFFSSFAINMALQYKKVGRWKNYLFSERTYIVLSLVAKSALAWQIFAGTLRP
jgi:sulfite exporter TauE/SafE